MDNIITTFLAIFSAAMTFSLPLQADRAQAERVVMYNSEDHPTLDWTVFPTPSEATTGSVWQETGSSFNRRYRICQVASPAANWLRLPYMRRGDASRIHVEIHFTMSECTETQNAQLCKETFDLYFFESDSEQASDTYPPWQAPPYKKVQRIASAGRFSDPGADATEYTTIAHEHFPVLTEGFFIAFKDEGACLAIVKVIVFKEACPQVTQNYAIFNKTFEGRELKDLVEVTGTCVDNSIPLGNALPIFRCQFGGTWTLAMNECGCKQGYQPTSTQDGCEACSVGTYKADASSDRCRPCPAQSHASERGMTSCTCVHQHFRSKEEPASAACSSAPREPLHIRADVDAKSSVVTLTWSPPNPGNSGAHLDVLYWVECPACTRDTVYSPSQFMIEGSKAIISNLESHTKYEFRVHSWNAISNQSGEDYYSTVEATTLSAVPSSVREVTVIKENLPENSMTLQWREPLYPNGNITGYEIRYRPSRETESVNKFQYKEAPEREKLREYESKVIQGLEPGVEYIFEVAAKNEDGLGVYSLPVIITTKGGSPENPLATAIIAGAISAIFIIVLLVAAVIFLVFWRRKSLRELKRSLEGKATSLSPPTFNRKMSRQLYYKIATTLPRNKEIPTLEDGTLVYSNGINGETVILPHIGKIRTYVDPSTYENPDEAVKEFASEIDHSCIRILDVIGGGEFGDVCSGLMLMPDKTTRNVAVKTLKTGATDKDRSDFLAEASIMGQFDDPNVIKLLGVVTKTRPAMIVTEFMENGSLDKFLRDNDGRFTITQLLGMMRGISSGMRYLSEMNYVHRDLAGRNILVNEHLVCKVADFGLSRQKEFDGAYETKGGKIPIRWTAPEAIAYKKFTSASDVWSLGIVMWEIMSYGERPYWNWPNQDVIKAVEKGYRLPPPMDCPEAIHQLMLDCWQRERNHRPTFATIVSTLDRLIRNPNALRCLAKNGTLPMNGFTDISNIHTVSEWLDSIKMARYKENFAEAGYVRLEDIARLSQSDLPRLGVCLVGHQKKIMKGIHSIRAQLEQAAETLV